MEEGGGRGRGRGGQSRDGSSGALAQHLPQRMGACSRTCSAHRSWSHPPPRHRARTRPAHNSAREAADVDSRRRRTTARAVALQSTARQRRSRVKPSVARPSPPKDPQPRRAGHPQRCSIAHDVHRARAPCRAVSPQRGGQQPAASARRGLTWLRNIAATGTRRFHTAARRARGPWGLASRRTAHPERTRSRVVQEKHVSFPRVCASVCARPFEPSGV